jgi:hypothetical protein
MPEHDNDLIAALADGSLDPDRAAEVEAAILADPDAAAELAAQRAALEAISSAGPVMMSADERSLLHHRVAQTLELEMSEAPIVDSPAPARRSWRPFTVAAASAAALVAVLAAGPLLNMISDGGVGFTFDLAALRSAEQADRAPTDSDDGIDLAHPSATESEQQSIGFGSDPQEPPSTVVVETPPDVETTTIEEEANGLREELETERAQPSTAFLEADTVDDTTVCLHEALAYFEGGDDALEAEGLQIHVVEYTAKGGRQVLVFFYRVPDSEEIHAMAAFDPTGCTTVATATR